MVPAEKRAQSLAHQVRDRRGKVRPLRIRHVQRNPDSARPMRARRLDLNIRAQQPRLPELHLGDGAVEQNQQVRVFLARRPIEPHRGRKTGVPLVHREPYRVLITRPKRLRNRRPVHPHAGNRRGSERPNSMPRYRTALSRAARTPVSARRGPPRQPPPARWARRVEPDFGPPPDVRQPARARDSTE